MYQIFENESENLEIYKYYCNSKNFLVDTVSEDSNKPVIIFFTGHGLYFPTSIEMFRKKVLEENRFEWKNIAKSSGIRDKVSKIIYIRDIYKNWCLKGINANMNSIPKMIEWFQTIISGRNVVTVGSSAGGYMAILFGYLLKAKSIYTFSPQISLYEYNKWHSINYYDEYVNDPSINIYMDLRQYMSKFEGKIYYITPYYCPEDKAQLDCLKECSIPNLKLFTVDENRHGYTVYGASIEKILVMSEEKLDALCDYYDGKIIKPSHFCAKTSGPIKAISISFYRTLKKLKNFVTVCRKQ